ncbi:DUF1501 domain-containing protein [Piscinibacter sakaiensis]|uniref:Putative exported protein n=1 Tax=Piscinibacter sakaiensis TaxID=1547922 RepID=A0A0K8NYR6_PISS1|nr:DUF1501 domain-containing protein [Piscinibacter sakaiensis]GAP35444.1 putative exported protein [Piscinibacter sakaiensis]
MTPSRHADTAPPSDPDDPAAPAGCAFGTRRRWLGGMAALALGSLGAGPRLALAATATATPAAARGERLVVVLLRGALDGLAAVPAVGDPAWSRLRPPSPEDERAGAPRPLDGLFALHPGLETLHGWYGEGRLLVVHAVASAHRERSHFDAQQLLESGGTRPFALSTGWLGRALAARDGRGLALGPALPLGLRGAPGASSWAPTRQAEADGDLLARVQRLYAGDGALADAFGRAADPRQRPMDEGPGAGGAGFVALAEQAGRFLAADDGSDVAWLDGSGWDTHTQQAGRLGRLLPTLDRGLGALRQALGPQWARTTVLVMTEFGRTAALNGSGGTDHGTGGVAFLAGGAVAGGRVLADWPGLAPAQLLDGRDLRPTQDLRALIRPVLQRQFGLGDARLAREVLPDAPPALQGLWHA